VAQGWQRRWYFGNKIEIDGSLGISSQKGCTLGIDCQFFCPQHYANLFQNYVTLVREKLSDPQGSGNV